LSVFSFFGVSVLSPSNFIFTISVCVCVFTPFPFPSSDPSPPPSSTEKEGGGNESKSAKINTCLFGNAAHNPSTNRVAPVGTNMALGVCVCVSVCVIFSRRVVRRKVVNLVRRPLIREPCVCVCVCLWVDLAGEVGLDLEEEGDEGV
jgi:hypothetical protein